MDSLAVFDIRGDIEYGKGYIPGAKAKIVHFDDLNTFAVWNAARIAGELRLVGKDYLIKDGDVILFRFNV